MFQEKLDSLYDGASNDKLLEMFDKSIDMQAKADAIEKQADSILSNVKETILRRFDGTETSGDVDLFSTQVNELSKQWSLLAASSVMVERSIKLPGFHIDKESRDMNLYISRKYGIKSYKTYHLFSPFGGVNMKTLQRSDVPMSYEYDDGENILKYFRHYYNDGILDFKVLARTKQLDQGKVDQLMELTGDICSMIKSWSDMYNNRNIARIGEIEDFIKSCKGYSSKVDNEEIRNKIKHLDEMVSFRKKAKQDILDESTKWAPMIKKWQEINKNFLVLLELSKKEIKI